jgi:hypothetical protein
MDIKKLFYYLCSYITLSSGLSCLQLYFDVLMRFKQSSLAVYLFTKHANTVRKYTFGNERIWIKLLVATHNDATTWILLLFLRYLNLGIIFGYILTRLREIWVQTTANGLLRCLEMFLYSKELFQINFLFLVWMKCRRYKQNTKTKFPIF